MACCFFPSVLCSVTVAIWKVDFVSEFLMVNGAWFWETWKERNSFRAFAVSCLTIFGAATWFLHLLERVYEVTNLSCPKKQTVSILPWNAFRWKEDCRFSRMASMWLNMDAGPCLEMLWNASKLLGKMLWNADVWLWRQLKSECNAKWRVYFP